MKAYLKEKEAVLAELGSSMEGLSDGEAAERLNRDGPNKLKEGKKVSLVKIRKTEFIKNTSRKITRFNIDKSVD